jgi:DHA1 family tetracycline resistance protein-like MFS transporter
VNDLPLSHTTEPRKAALAFIFITVVLDILAFGVIIPVLPHLIESFVGGNTSQAAQWVGIFSAVFALIQFLSSPLQGALSDHWGRRPVILLSNLGLGLDFILMACVNTLPLMFIGRVISGITAASFSTANAYIADVTPPEKRAGSYGLLGAAFGIGFIIGPALGGFLSTWDLRAPFWLSACLALANFAYGYFVLPESLPKSQRAPFRWRRANPLGSLILLRSYPQVLGLAVLVFLSNMSHYVLPSTFVLYGDYRYHWSAQKVGYVLALVGVLNALVQAVLVKKIVPILGEHRTLLVGLVCGACGFAWMGLASSGTWFLVSLPLLALWGLSGPSVQSLMTRQVSAQEQGQLQGAVSSLSSLAGIVAPFMFAYVFSFFIQSNVVVKPFAPLLEQVELSGAAFLLAALILLAAIFISFSVTRSVSKRAFS